METNTNQLVVDNDKDDTTTTVAASSLLARLNAQFGDLDLTELNLLSDNNGDNINQNQQQQNINDNNNDNTSIDSEESSIIEPTPEELALWQTKQFEKGANIIQQRKEQTMDPIQKRRLILQKEQQQQQKFTMIPSSTNDDDTNDDDWEEIAALPDLQGQASVFFTTAAYKIKDDTTNGNSDAAAMKDDDEDPVMVGVSPLLQTLCTNPNGDPELFGTKWHRLYSSIDGDGLSFWNLWYELHGYTGPTLLLMRCIPSQSKTIVSCNKNDPMPESSTAATIGFFTTLPWQESTEYQDSYSPYDTSFLFAMEETENHVEFFNLNKEQRRKKQNGYMYCHPSTMSTKRGCSRSSTNYPSNNGTSSCINHKTINDKTDGAVHGIAIGGKPNQPRLHITESLEDCRCLTYDSGRTFIDGDLFLNKLAFQDSLYYFDVEYIEVWGVGGISWIQDAISARDKTRGISESHIQRRKQIFDKAQLLDDFRNGLHSTTTKDNTSSYFDHIGYADDHCDV